MKFLELDGRFFEGGLLGLVEARDLRHLVDVLSLLNQILIWDLWRGSRTVHRLRRFVNVEVVLERRRDFSLHIDPVLALMNLLEFRLRQAICNAFWQVYVG